MTTDKYLLFHWWLTPSRLILSLYQKRSFFDWVSATFSEDQLQRIVTDAVEYDPYDFEPPSVLLGGRGPWHDELDYRRFAVRRLFRRYGEEIWDHAVWSGLEIASPGADMLVQDFLRRQHSTLQFITKLTGAHSVNHFKQFEELLVTHALAAVAKKLLLQKSLEMRSALELSAVEQAWKPNKTPYTQIQRNHCLIVS